MKHPWCKLLLWSLWLSFAFSFFFFLILASAFYLGIWLWTTHWDLSIPKQRLPKANSALRFSLKNTLQKKKRQTCKWVIETISIRKHVYWVAVHGKILKEVTCGEALWSTECHFCNFAARLTAWIVHAGCTWAHASSSSKQAFHLEVGGLSVDWVSRISFGRSQLFSSVWETIITVALSVSFAMETAWTPLVSSV